jgi:hypothetical protein
MAPLFGESDEMKKVGEDMQKLSEQIATLQQQLAAKTAEADALRTQAAQGAGNAVALEDANAQLDVLRNQLAELKSKASATPSPATTSAPAPSAANMPAAASRRLEAGATAWVTQAGGLPLRLRSGPSLEADIIDRLKPGTQLTLIEGPIFDTGHSWWRINTADGRHGWVAGDQLVLQPD